MKRSARPTRVSRRRFRMCQWRRHRSAYQRSPLVALSKLILSMQISIVLQASSWILNKSRLVLSFGEPLIRTCGPVTLILESTALILIYPQRTYKVRAVFLCVHRVVDFAINQLISAASNHYRIRPQALRPADLSTLERCGKILMVRQDAHTHAMLTSGLIRDPTCEFDHRP